MSKAIEDIAAERQRQIEVEGWAPDHDDAHDDDQLAAAASCYALPPGDREGVFKGKRGHLSWSNGAPVNWPWDVSWWKPGERRRELVKVGALIVAEIERLDRSATKAETAPLDPERRQD